MQRPLVRARATRWLPLCLLSLFALGARPFLPPWGFMWCIALALFLGCKWLTLAIASRADSRPSTLRTASYLLAWPGMDARQFLFTKPGAISGEELRRAGVRAVIRIAFGTWLVFSLSRCAGDRALGGWVGMVGLVLMLHFGLFDLLVVAWRAAGVNAAPLMNKPLRAQSVGEFWSRRWNAAFNRLAFDQVFRPLARRIGTPWAALSAFGVSGLVHELVISLPAGAGYGWPTTYFLLQGGALVAEHSAAGRRFGLGCGARGRLFTLLVVALPAFWLFHPPFVHRVIIPFLQAIGAL